MVTGNFTVGFEDLSSSARIREAALRLFAERGPNHTSLRQIAEAAGVSPGAIMHHFGSKDELERAVQRSVMSSLQEAISGVGLQEGPEVAARKRREAYDRFLIANPHIGEYTRHVQMDGGHAGLELFAEMMELIRTEMHSLIAAGLARPMPDEAVGLILYRILQGAHILFRPMIEATLGVSMSDPEVQVRFREALIDLLTNPLLLVEDKKRSKKR